MNGRYRWDVVISYSRRDLEVVRTIHADLERRGLRVWRDENQIPAGAVFSKAIEEALQDTAAVGVIVSPDAISSKWVQEEYYRALSLANRPTDPLRLIPILVKDAELPGFLANRQWVDLRDAEQFPTNIERIVEAVKGAVVSTSESPRPELLPFKFLWYFPEGLLRRIYDRFAIHNAMGSLSQPGLTETVELNGIELVRAAPERLLELKSLLSDESEEGRQVFAFLQRYFAEDDPFAYSEELGVGRALLLRDLVHLARFLSVDEPQEAEGRSQTLELARELLSKIVEERHTRIAFEVNQGILDLSFAPSANDQLMRAKLLLSVGEAERAADLFEIYRGNNLFAEAELDDLRRVQFAIDWAKATKDAGRARKMHAELMMAYNRMIDIVSHLVELLPQPGLLDSLQADILHNRATQAAVFGDDAEWSKAQMDFKTAAAQYEKAGNHDGFLTCQCALVAHSLDRLGDRAPLSALHKMLELDAEVGASEPGEALFFYYYQKARVLKRMHPADANPAIEAYLSAERVAKEAGLEHRAAIARGWALELQWGEHTISENDYLSGLQDCVIVLQRFPQDGWSVHVAVALLARLAKLYILRSENNSAWRATVEIFDVDSRQFDRGGRVAGQNALDQLRILAQLQVSEAQRASFLHDFDLRLRSLLGLRRWESLTWEKLQMRLKSK